MALDLIVLFLHVSGKVFPTDVRAERARALFVPVEISWLPETGRAVVGLQMPVQLALRDVLAVRMDRAAVDSCLHHRTVYFLTSAVDIIIAWPSLITFKSFLNRGI